jgi:hypothetical protein
MAVRAGGCILQLRQARARQYIPAILASSNKGWQHRWFYLQNDDGRLLSFSQRVVTAAGDNWRYGAPRERQKNLQPLLKALEELREGGLTAAGVVASIHRRRVLPLTERRLPLWEMTPEDAVDRAARRVATEKRKEKKDAKKARARERMRARDTLERLRRRQERDGLPREPSPETPDDDDDNDEDDDEDDDMATRLGLSPDLRLG